MSTDSIMFESKYDAMDAFRCGNIGKNELFKAYERLDTPQYSLMGHALFLLMGVLSSIVAVLLPSEKDEMLS